MEISVDGDLSVRKGHAIAHKVEETIIASETRVVEVAVHVNPKDISPPQ
jgi:divalent metal cation (Fe/Co/Zn/Cd) transporter